MPATAAPPIKVPPMSQLTAGAPPAPAPAPAAGAEPKEPTAAPDPEPRPGTETQPSPPVIDTQIVQPAGGAPVGTPKAKADFIRERHQNKQERVDAAALQAQLDQHKMEVVQKDLELEKLNKELEDHRKKLGDEKKIADQRKKELEEMQAGYFESHRAVWNPAEDEQFQSAQTTMIETLRSKLPMRVPSQFEDGKIVNESRVFFDAILSQNGAPAGLANILDAYAVSKRHANEEGMNHAINAMAQFLGADVSMTDTEKRNWKLLPPSDATFKQIEQALEDATPHHLARTQRYSEIQKQGPVLAQQQYQNRESGIRQSLASQIFLAPDAAASRLKDDPQDTTALMGVLASQAPALKEIMERQLNDLAPAFAAMGDKLYLPGLASADPSQITAHRAKEAQVRQTISNAMRFAVIGASVGPVIANLIAERDLAEERANAASLLTNPTGEGAVRAGKDGRPPAPHIETEIVTGR